MFAQRVGLLGAWMEHAMPPDAGLPLCGDGELEMTGVYSIYILEGNEIALWAAIGNSENSVYSGVLLSRIYYQASICFVYLQILSDVPHVIG